VSWKQRQLAMLAALSVMLCGIAGEMGETFATLLVEATIEAGTPVGRHTHPGIESAYFLEGGFELPVQGQETRMMKAGDAVQIPAETAHGGGKAGNART
jgi:quercetin dioxygenase-like cupin family protein